MARKKWANVHPLLDRVNWKKYGSNPHSAVDGIQKALNKLDEENANPKSLEKVAVLEKIKAKLEEALSYDVSGSEQILTNKINLRGPAEEEGFLTTPGHKRNPYVRYH